jgi:hypothetical protein
LAVRLLSIALAAIVASAGGACGGGAIVNLPLTWRGGKLPSARPPVAGAFAAAPFTFGVRDLRGDPSVVGMYESDGFVVRTTDNVAQYCSNRIGEMLSSAGARLNEAPVAVVEAELLEFRVVEAGTFNGLMRLRVIVHRGSGEPWSTVYEGKARRWGRTHSPDNFNEALSIALTDVVHHMLADDGFARALTGELTEPARPYSEASTGDARRWGVGTLPASPAGRGATPLVALTGRRSGG